MYRLIIIFIFIPLVFGCSFSNSRKNNSTTQVFCEPDDKIIVARNETVSSVKAIDFFGIKLQGELSDIINKIYQLPVLSCVEQRDSVRCESGGVMYLYHTVEFCGVQCGMNVRYKKVLDKDIAIHELNFITSQTEDVIIDKFVSELTKYYGNPSIADDKEDSYHWYWTDGLCVRARHLHAHKGGWTVFMYMI